MKKKKRIIWLDVLKAIAIFAVCLDHGSVILSMFLPNQGLDIVWRHTYFSVPWFLLIMGMTTSLSMDPNAAIWRNALNFYKKRINYIGIYVIASTIGYFWSSFPTYSLGNLLWNILTFNALSPFYFFLIMFECFLVAPFFYAFFKKSTLFIFGLMTVIMYLFLFQMDMIQIPPIFTSAWRAPFGGMFLIFFWIGMGYDKFKDELKQHEFLLATTIFLITEYWIVKTQGAQITVPITIQRIAWTVSGLFVFKNIIERIPFEKIFAPLVFIGRRTLPIFIYHAMIMNSIRQFLPTTWTGLTTIIIISMAGSLLIDYLVQWIQIKIVQSFQKISFIQHT